MKKITLIIITIFITTFTYGQTFEGKLNYSNTFKSKNTNITDQQWSIMMGSKFEYSIKNGDYKSISNGTIFQWQLYINKENKIYNKFTNSIKALWMDASINEDEILKTEINKNVTKVLGYNCDELILTCKSGVQKYYYNSSVLKADTNLFTNHNYANWNQFLKTTKCLSLKSIIETDQFILESVVTEIIPTKFDSKTFEIPGGIETAKQ